MVSRLRTSGKKRAHGKAVYLSVFPETYKALESFASDRGLSVHDAIELIIEAEMIAQEKLPPKLTPAAFRQGHEDSQTPWEPHSELIWYSPRPVKTWATFFHAVEFDTKKTLLELCNSYGISQKRARLQFRRYDAWRRGQPVIPPARLTTRQPRIVDRDLYDRLQIRAPHEK